MMNLVERLALILALLYLAGINLAGFLSMKIDKERAVQKKWRIRERTLFLIALAGGSIGSMLGMRCFRHKTKHWYFVIGMPVILILQLLLAGLLVWRDR